MTDSILTRNLMTRLDITISSVSAKVSDYHVTALERKLQLLVLVSWWSLSSNDFVLPARLSIVNSNASKTTVEPSEAAYSNLLGLAIAYTSKFSIIYKIRKSKMILLFIKWQACHWDGFLCC
jgi:hypothetical protein